MSQTICIFCAVEMTLKTIFGKQVYECPRCKRRVPVGDIVTGVVEPETSS